MANRDISAAGFVYLFGDADLNMRKIAETATTITFEWDPPAYCNGYRFTREKAPVKPNGMKTYSHTWDGLRDRVTFSKDSEWYSVEALSIPFADIWP